MKIARVLLAPTLALCATLSQAQVGVLEEVTVTARKIEESLQDTPVSISAFTSAALEARSIQKVNEVAFYTPNLSAAQGYSGGSDGFYYIRGVGINDFTAAMDPPVGVYLDGVYLGRTAGSTFDLVDVERIEVLRGPQGTLFGRNTSGGAISVTSRRPGEEFGGKAALQGGDRDWMRGELDLDVPLIEGTLLSRLSLLKNKQDGWTDRLWDGNTLGDEDTDAAQLILQWLPSDDLSILLSGDYSKNDGTPQPQITSGAALPSSSPCPPFCIPLPADINEQASPSFDKTWAAEKLQNDLEVWGVSGVIDWDLGGMALKSITAYRKLDQHTAADFDVTSYVFYDDDIPLDQKQFSQEFQLSGTAFDSRMNWLAGAYYFDEEIDQTNAITLGATGPGGVLFAPVTVPIAPGVDLPVVPMVVDPPLPGDPGYRVINSQNILPKTEAWAGFGQIDYALTDKLKLNAGVRYSEDDKEQKYNFYIINSIPNHPLYPVATIPTVQTKADNTWDSWDPRVGLEYAFTDEVMTYVSYASGFRSGGFNSRPVEPPITSFDPEEVSTYEVGIKSEWFERRMRLNAAAFYTEYDNMQIQVLSGGFFDITNAGDAEISGGELELTGVIGDNFNLNAGIGYLDAKYTSVTEEAIAAGVTKNNDLPMTPEWTVNLGAQYRLPLGRYGSVVARADYIFEDSRYTFANNAPGNKLESYDLVNVRLTWTSPEETWDVAVIGTNVNNEEYLRFAEDVRAGASPLGTLIQYPAPPRTWSVRAGYHF